MPRQKSALPVIRTCEVAAGRRLKELVAGDALPRRTRPYRPQTNGKVERLTPHCSRRGPTFGPTAQRQGVGDALTADCTCTTTTPHPRWGDSPFQPRRRRAQGLHL